MKIGWNTVRRNGTAVLGALGIALAGAVVAFVLIDWYHDTKLARLREWRPGVMVCGNDRFVAQMYGIPAGAVVMLIVVEYVSSRRRRPDT